MSSFALVFTEVKLLNSLKYLILWVGVREVKTLPLKVTNMFGIT